MHNFIKQSCSVVIADGFPKHEIVMLFCRAYVIAGSGMVAVIHVLVPLSVLVVVFVLAT